MSDKWTAIKLWIENEEPLIVLFPPVHTAARKVIVATVHKDGVTALHRRPNVYMPFVEGLEARNFGNLTERPRERGKSRRIAILGDEPKQTQSGLVGGENWLDFHPYLYG